MPSLEAMAAGMALVMTDCSPNEVWPGPKVGVARRRTVRMRCGEVLVSDPDVGHLASILNDLARHPDRVAGWQAESRAWAAANSWEALRPLWLDELQRACSSPGQAAANTVNAPTAGSVNA